MQWRGGHAGGMFGMVEAAVVSAEAERDERSRFGLKVACGVHPGDGGRREGEERGGQAGGLGRVRKAKGKGKGRTPRAKSRGGGQGMVC